MDAAGAVITILAMALLGSGEKLSEREVRLIHLAKAAIRAEVLGSSPVTAAESSQVQPVFVTIESHGKILGCRGTLQNKGDSLEAAVTDAARNAAAHDPRYAPLTPQQLNDFQVTITIVDRLEELGSVAGLKPDDGLVVSNANRFGIVLPWEGKDPSTRLKWAYQKARLPIGSPVRLQRLIATRFRG